MIKQAILDRGLAMYAELVAVGELERAVQARAELFERIFACVSNDATATVLRANLPFEEGVAMLEAADRAGVEQALAAALDFPTDESPAEELLFSVRRTRRSGSVARRHCYRPGYTLITNGSTDLLILGRLAPAVRPAGSLLIGR